MTVDDVKAKGYKLHHTATKRGYISRKGGEIVNEYEGRYGVGYTVEIPNWNSTNFHYISYYLKED